MPISVIITPDNPVEMLEWDKFCHYYGITYNHGTTDFITQIYGATVRIATFDTPITKFVVSYYDTKPHAVARISLLILQKYPGKCEYPSNMSKFLNAEPLNKPFI